MKIDICKDELQEIRDIIHAGRDRHNLTRRDVKYDYQYKHQTRMFSIGTKLIRKINLALTKVHGHDCSGQKYLTKGIKLF